MTGKQRGFWDVEHRRRELSEHGDPLEKLAATVDFEMFRPDPEQADRLRTRSSAPLSAQLGDLCINAYWNGSLLRAWGFGYTPRGRFQ